MGGYIALALAELHPQDISGLCLMNSTSLADSEEKKQNRDRAVEAVKNNHKSFVRIAVPGLFAPENRNRFKESVKQAVQVGLQMTPEGIAAALKGMKIRKDRSLVFENGKYLKLLVIGKKDSALDIESLLPLSNYPLVETAVFNDGHMSHIENREELEKHLIQFLKRTSSAERHA
jgi:pimeloyl-ACP methyl ester carboxylesterase